jgi:hypothetical protein
MLENRQEITNRRLPGDDLYLPDGINWPEVRSPLQLR